jgi:hypothetical protein
MTDLSKDAPRTDSLPLSPDFSGWLAGQDASLALGTYQAGRLVMMGVRRLDS